MPFANLVVSAPAYKVQIPRGPSEFAERILNVVLRKNNVCLTPLNNAIGVKILKILLDHHNNSAHIFII